MKQETAIQRWKVKGEKMIPTLLFLFTSISILTTIGIIYILFSESVHFFREVPIWEFFTSTNLKPLSENQSFGVLPLLVCTFTATIIALIVVIPIVLMSAIYIIEYEPKILHKIIKHSREI